MQKHVTATLFLIAEKHTAARPVDNLKRNGSFIEFLFRYTNGFRVEVFCSTDLRAICVNWIPVSLFGIVSKESAELPSNKALEKTVAMIRLQWGIQMTYRCFADHGADHRVYSFDFGCNSVAHSFIGVLINMIAMCIILTSPWSRWKRVTTHKTDEHQHLCTTKNALIGQCAVV